jgi:beta-phosphoglucomutase
MGLIKAVVFDLDGVLIDATEWHYRALNRALELFGYTINQYEHLSHYNGLPTGKKLEMLTVEKNLPKSLHGLIKRLKQKYTREEILGHSAPTFDKELMVRNLRRDGYRLAVCSNSIRDSVDLMLRSTNLLEHMEFFLSNEDVSKPKPDSEVYRKAFSKLGLAPNEVMVVEDAEPGVIAATQSGAHVCRVSGYSAVDYFLVREALERFESRGGRQ